MHQRADHPMVVLLVLLRVLLLVQAGTCPPEIRRYALSLVPVVICYIKLTRSENRCAVVHTVFSLLQQPAIFSWSL